MEDNSEWREVSCGERTIKYLLTRKQVKNINLRIRPEGKVFVSANETISSDYIDDFVKKKQVYILKALSKFGENKHYSNTPRKYVSGENFDILGKGLRLKVLEGTEEGVSSDGVFIYLTVKDKENGRHKELLMSNWLKEKQVSTFQEICKETYRIFRKYDIAYPFIHVRNMESRWGSCQPDKGGIILNSKLIEAPRNCIEYVVLHEFSHFIYPNHSRQFYDFLSMQMPDWKDRKKELEKRL